jgi:hypothetical protein
MLDPESYVQQAALLVGLELDPAHRKGVVEQIARLAALAEWLEPPIDGPAAGPPGDAP